MVLDVVVIGAGPVGCLAALALAKRGRQVTVYEMRPDLRSAEQRQLSGLRSINLALSSRGIEAMQAVDPDLATRVLKLVTPVHARMIHDPQGNQSSQVYGLHGETINSVDRAELNRCMLDELDLQGVEIKFGHRFVSANLTLEPPKLELTAGGEPVSVVCNVVIGADGSFSRVRDQLQRAVKMDYCQEYIDHLYLELKIPAGGAGASSDSAANTSGKGPAVGAVSAEVAPVLDPNHLHIWPRHEYMLMALANQDLSFTSTLFAPASLLNSINSAAKFLDFFHTQFPDAAELIGDDALANVYQNAPRGSLMTVTCRPYHHKGRAIIIGDAAHAMVPFYGQGMNCGFEDVRVLLEELEKSGGVEAAFESYSADRHPDLVSIVDLAMRNYVEMRHQVTSWKYLLRKRADGLLTRLLGDRNWIALYTMVSFRPDIAYSTAVARDRWQTGLLNRLGRGLLVGGVYGLTLLALTKMKVEQYQGIVRGGIVGLAMYLVS